MRSRLARLPLWVRVIGGALAWLALISWAHLRLNFEQHGRPTLRMGYMPVVTNLAAPVLDHVSKEGNGVRFEALKFSSFADMAAALRDGHIDAGFIIAPLSIVMRQQGLPVKVVYIGNRHESTLVARTGLAARSFRDLATRKIAVPMRYSGHNLAVRRLAEQAGLRESELDIVEMNPPDMAAALNTGELDAYFVGEPFAAQSVQSGAAEVLHQVEEGWPGFICNLMLVTESTLERRPRDVALMVAGAARSGLWARENPEDAARLAARYWNQKPELTTYTFGTPPGRFVYDRFAPKEEELQYLADQMVRFGLLENNDISGLVDDRFARQADLTGIDGLESILPLPDSSNGAGGS